MACNNVLCVKSGTPKTPSQEHNDNNINEYKRTQCVYIRNSCVVHLRNVFLSLSKGANKGSEQLKDESETKTECVQRQRKPLKLFSLVFLRWGLRKAVGMLSIFILLYSHSRGMMIKRKQVSVWMLSIVSFHLNASEFKAGEEGKKYVWMRPQTNNTQIPRKK